MARDPFGRAAKQAQEHGMADGEQTAADALTADALNGYIEDNLDGDLLEEGSTAEIDRVVNAYATYFIKGFAEKCRATLNEFLEEADEEDEVEDAEVDPDDEELDDEELDDDEDYEDDE